MLNMVNIGTTWPKNTLRKGLVVVINEKAIDLINE